MPSHGKSPPASKHSNTQLTLDQDDLTAQVARVLVEMQRQVPVTQKVQRTVEVPLVSRQLVCCMGSMLTSHLRATHDAAVKECVETDVSKFRFDSKFLDVVEGARCGLLLAVGGDAVRRKSEPLEPSAKINHAGYSPPCGACKGVGGIASSDTASDVQILPCKIDASTVNPLRPLWGNPFTELVSHEILIGKQNVCLF